MRRSVLRAAAIGIIAFSAAGAAAHELSRQGASGQHISIIISARWDKSCAQKGFPSYALTQQPAHGSVSTAPEKMVIGGCQGERSDEGCPCSGKEVVGLAIYYTSQPGFHGRDEFNFDTIFDAGVVEHNHATVEVQAEPPPSVADLTAATAAFSDPAGAYAISGSNPDGTTFSGEAAVERDGDDRYRASWTVGSWRLEGVGLRYLNVLAVGFRDGGDMRLALYGEEGEGRLGVWARSGAQKMGSERWVRQGKTAQPHEMPGPAGNPEGEYTVSGVAPDGQTYSGDAVVSRVGNVFQITRTVGEKSICLGVAYSDFFATSCRQGDRIAVALLKSLGDGRIGLWTSEARPGLGAEKWTRMK